MRLTSPAGGSVHEMVHGDCVEEMMRRPASSVDAIVTSPPYNLGVRYNSYDDRLPREEYLRWTLTWAKACRRLLAPGGSLFLNVGSKPSDPWIGMDVAMVFRSVLTLQNTIHWIKSIATEDRDGTVRSLGHYKPIRSDRFLNDAHEYVFHFSESGDVKLDRLAVGVPYQDKTNVNRWAGKADLRCRGNTWFVPYDTIQSRAKDRPHPATFPEQLVERCLKLHGLERIRLAMDPFLGLGTTGVVCARLGLNFLGFELDEDYLSIAAARIEAALKASEGEAGPGPDSSDES